MKYGTDAMWKAVIEKDTNYDGLFYYGVKTVGVFCKPSCKSKDPLLKNIIFFETKQQALDSGFRPCKRCRPDLDNYEPLADLAKEMKDMIDSYYSERKKLSNKLEQLGATRNHLSVVFKQQFGISPMEYRNEIRLTRAKELLRDTNVPITEIAQEIGFDSLPSFYAFFRKHVGETPKEYRKGNIL